MTYRGVSGNNKKLGIKPTDEDRAFVHTLARMKLGVRRIAVLMGERYGLGKPMSRMALYYHHREDLKPKKGEQEHSKKVRVKLEWERGVTEALERIIKHG